MNFIHFQKFFKFHFLKFLIYFTNKRYSHRKIFQYTFHEDNFYLNNWIITVLFPIRSRGYYEIKWYQCITHCYSPPRERLISLLVHVSRKNRDSIYNWPGFLTSCQTHLGRPPKEFRQFFFCLKIPTIFTINSALPQGPLTEPLIHSFHKSGE